MRIIAISIELNINTEFKFTIMLKNILITFGLLTFSSLSTVAEATTINTSLSKSSEQSLLAQSYDDIRIYNQIKIEEQRRYIDRLKQDFVRKGDYIGLGNMYYSQGYSYRGFSYLPRAIDAYTMAIEANPKNYLGYFLRANAKSEQGGGEDANLRNAMPDYDMAIALNPEADAVYNDRAINKNKLKDKNGSLQDFRSAARILRAKGDTKELAATLRRIQYFFKLPE